MLSIIWSEKSRMRKEMVLLTGSPRCMYDNSFAGFLHDPEMAVLGVLHDKYHGDTRTTTTEAWKEEIQSMRSVVAACETDGHIIERLRKQFARMRVLCKTAGAFYLYEQSIQRLHNGLNLHKRN